MIKFSLKIMGLAFASFIILEGQGVASLGYKWEFHGCYKNKGAYQACSWKCGNLFTNVYKIEKNGKKCKDPKKPQACYCNELVVKLK